MLRAEGRGPRVTPEWMPAEYSISLDSRHPKTADAFPVWSLLPMQELAGTINHRTNSSKSTNKDNAAEIHISLSQPGKEIFHITICYTPVGPARQLPTSKPTQQAGLQHKRPDWKKMPSSSFPKGSNKGWEPAWGSWKRDTEARCLHLVCLTAYAKEKSKGWNQSFSSPEPLLWHSDSYLATPLPSSSSELLKQNQQSS